MQKLTNIVAQSPQAKQSERVSERRSQQYRQLGLFDPQSTEVLPQIKSQKPQISSTPGTSPKVRNRYRVRLGDEILGDHLSLDEALALANPQRFSYLRGEGDADKLTLSNQSTPI